jgi:hypothetical protein
MTEIPQFHRIAEIDARKLRGRTAEVAWAGSFLMSALAAIKNLPKKIPAPLWSAAGMVLDVSLPGARAVVDLVRDTVQWANGTDDAAILRRIAEDGEKTKQVLEIVTTDLQNLTQVVGRMIQQSLASIAR